MSGIGGVRYHKKDFWSRETLKYVQPHYRLEKVARLVNRVAGSQECDLLDVGCGPATLAQLLRPTIRYHGIDIAIPEPAPNLREVDILEAPISFGDKQFDIIVAQGLFEYLGDHQAATLSEVAQLLKVNGTFIVSYTNFLHRNPSVYWPYSNVQPVDAFRQSLASHFTVRDSFPTSHNWNHSEPTRPLVKLVNMPVRRTIPFVSTKLAVSYLFVCSRLPSPRSGTGSSLDRRAAN